MTPVDLLILLMVVLFGTVLLGAAFYKITQFIADSAPWLALLAVTGYANAKDAAGAVLARVPGVVTWPGNNLFRVVGAVKTLIRPVAPNRPNSQIQGFASGIPTSPLVEKTPIRDFAGDVLSFVLRHWIPIAGILFVAFCVLKFIAPLFSLCVPGFCESKQDVIEQRDTALIERDTFKLERDLARAPIPAIIQHQNTRTNLNRAVERARERIESVPHESRLALLRAWRDGDRELCDAAGAHACG